ncbi:MAG TPA: hypothetical protein VKK06_21300 [Terriglobia bacterium]|nr:hypothetical protein [Terriglobia bacterium]
MPCAVTDVGSLLEQEVHGLVHRSGIVFRDIQNDVVTQGGLAALRSEAFLTYTQISDTATLTAAFRRNNKHEKFASIASVSLIVGGIGIMNIQADRQEAIGD